MTKEKTLAKLHAKKFYFKKKYGQNFIFDENILKSIVDKITINKEDLVLEVGAGAGNLTKLLAPRAKKVICYEIDERLVQILTDVLHDDFANIEIKHQDILTESFLKYENEKSQYQQIILIGNLPYVITTPLLFKVLHEGNMIDKMLLMVQKEVGERILAQPRNKEYNAISVLFQTFFVIKKEKEVNRKVFFPEPKVDSVVLSFVRKRTKNLDDDRFITFVKSCFKQKRKTLRNNLRDVSVTNTQKVEQTLRERGFSLDDRAEYIPVEVFMQLVKEVR